MPARKSAPGSVMRASDVVDVVGGARARLHARNEAALLLQVLRQVHRVEDDRRVEVAEEQDQDREREVVRQVARTEEAGDVRAAPGSW